MISPRFAPAVCVLVALALVPTVIHSYAGVRIVDDRRASAIPESLAGFSSTPGSRDSEWGRRRFESDDWIERRYAAAGHEVVLTVVRSYDPKTLYHHPELAIAYETAFLHAETVRFPSHPDMPVHVLRERDGQGAAAIYVLHYGDEFVEHPIRFQVRLAGSLLFSGRRPMTILFAKDGGLGASALDETTGLAKVLFGAVEAFTEQGRS